MSQPRVRKMLGSSAEQPRALASVAKASGESMKCPIRPQQEIFLSRSKNKIPKTVRYDLENALVGLCDVWFEVIKPHLVRNNIKLHVNGSSAGGDHEHPPAATTARAPPHSTPARAPPPAPLGPDCSHLDPASSPSCELCRLLLNAANCIESAVCQAAHAQLSPSVAAAVSAADAPIQSLNCEEKKLVRRCIRRKRRRFQPQPQPSWRVPRLCRTCTVLYRPRAGAGSRTTMDASHRPPQPPRDDYYRFIVPRRESVMKNKTTQTEKALCVSRGCQSRSPGSRSPAPRSPTCNSDPISPKCVSPPLIVPPHIVCRLRRPEATVAEIPPLLQDDLIDIIAESNEKRLRLLYSSSERDHPSYMKLFPNCTQEKHGLKKLPPWR